MTDLLFQECRDKECVPKGTLLADGKTRLPPDQSEILAEPGISKCMGFEISRTLDLVAETKNVTCWCSKSTIARKPGRRISLQKYRVFK